MQNNIENLTNHLFLCIERLSDENLTPEQLAVEIARSKQMTDAAKTIIDSGKLMVEAVRTFSDYNHSAIPDLLENRKQPRIASIK